jgi:hypothetical protein
VFDRVVVVRLVELAAEDVDLGDHLGDRELVGHVEPLPLAACLGELQNTKGVVEVRVRFGNGHGVCSSSA